MFPLYFTKKTIQRVVKLKLKQQKKKISLKTKNKIIIKNKKLK